MKKIFALTPIYSFNSFVTFDNFKILKKARHAYISTCEHIHHKDCILP